MDRPLFDVARQAFASLELYQEHHASGPKFQEHLQGVVAMLRERATNIRSTKHHDAKFFDGLAALLENMNKPG